VAEACATAAEGLVGRLAASASKKSPHIVRLQFSEAAIKSSPQKMALIYDVAHSERLVGGYLAMSSINLPFFEDGAIFAL